MKVKFFGNAQIQDLEEEINSWLNQHDNICFHYITTFGQVVAITGQTYLILAIWYMKDDE